MDPSDDSSASLPRPNFQAGPSKLDRSGLNPLYDAPPPTPAPRPLLASKQDFEDAPKPGLRARPGAVRRQPSGPPQLPAGAVPQPGPALRRSTSLVPHVRRTVSLEHKKAPKPQGLSLQINTTVILLIALSLALAFALQQASR